MAFPAYFPTLKVALTDWVEGDVASYYLACCLGLMGPEDGTLDGFRRAKHVFWSKHPLQQPLDEFLHQLANAEVLEFDETDGKYHFRWNPNFKGSWES